MAVIEGVTNEMVLQELFKYMPEDERAIMCSVYGDPATAAATAWGGTPWQLGQKSPLKHDSNNYVAISSFKASTNDSRYRRRKDQFGACHAIMVDDIGTKLQASSLPASIIPSLVIETSPGNYQATYFLAGPQENQSFAEDAIKQMISQLTGGGVDPGMAGVTRVLRLPQGINGKPKYKQDGHVWQCKVHVWRPDIRTSWVELERAFMLVEKNRTFAEPDDAAARERMRGFMLVKQAMKHLRMIKREGGGWIDIHCPWVNEHTGRADTGSAVSPPGKANGFFGGYKCHHGHCESRNWGDLEDEVARRVFIQGKKTAGPFLGA
jgi:hypothetical protein